MSLRDLVDGEARMDDDDNDEEVPDEYGGEEGEGEVREGAGTNNHYNDSSEEEDEEEDDEEAARAVSYDRKSEYGTRGLTFITRFAKVSLSMKTRKMNAPIADTRSAHALPAKKSI